MRAIKKPPGGGLPPSLFTVLTVTYRPCRAGFGTFKKDLKGCRADHRASSLTATLDSLYAVVKLLI